MVPATCPGIILILLALAILSPAPALGRTDPLTPAQRQWLKAHDGKIRMAPTPYWEPMEIYDEQGNYSGLVADVIKLLEKKLDFRFQLVRVDTWKEVFDKAAQRELDVISAGKSTPERDKIMSWSSPYLDIPNVVITRKSQARNLTLNDLAGKRVGVMGEYVISRYVAENYEKIRLIRLQNDLDGLRRVSIGDLDAVVVEFPYAAWAIERERITNLRIAGEVDYRSPQSIGVRNDWPVLKEILDKGLAMITPAERKQILGKWMYLTDPPFYQSKRFWTAFLMASGIISLIVLAVSAWNVALRKKVSQKTAQLRDELAEKERISLRLGESEQRLSTLISNFPGVAFRHHFSATNLVWPFEYMSSGGFELTGYHRLHGPGREVFFNRHVVHPEYCRANKAKIINALKKGKHYKIRYRIITRSGEEKWVWEQGVGIENADGAVDSVEGFITDVTNFVNAEQELKSSKKLFRDLVMNSPVGISIIRENAVVYHNPEFRLLFGKKSPAFDLETLDRIHPDDRRAAKAFFDEIRQGIVPGDEPDLRILPPASARAHHRRKWAHCRAAGIEYQGQKAILLIMLDTTHARELEKMVAVEDKMASLGRAAANIAHEVRNPLSGIYMYLTGMERNSIARGYSGEIQEDIDLIREAAADIETVIKRILDFSKPGLPKAAPTDLNAVARDTVELSKVSILKKYIRLDEKLSAVPLRCRADRNLLQRVLLNLIVNATEAMDAMDGGKRIMLASGRSGQTAWVSVSDSGPGVPEKKRESVFDPFYTTKSDGTGIGLSLCHRIMADHNGRISVSESALGGAEFKISLPVLNAPGTTASS